MTTPPLSFFQVMIVVLVVGSAFHPFSSALGLLAFLGHALADKYFTSNISNEERKELAAMKADLAKVKQAQQASDLGKSFGPR